LAGEKIRNPNIEIRNKSERCEMGKTIGRSIGCFLIFKNFRIVVSDFDIRISDFRVSGAG